MNFKKITAFIMSMALTMSCAAAGIPGTVYAEGSDDEPFSAKLYQNYDYSTSEETIYDIEFQSIDRSVETLVIPSEYQGVKTGGIAYLKNDDIKNIIFPADFTSIRTLECPNLECVVMPDDITDVNVPALGKNVTIIGNGRGFASYYASANRNPFRQSGDINADGKVSAADIVSMISYLTGRTDADGIAKLAADIDHDGRMSIADIVRMKSLVLEGGGSLNISGCLADPDLFGFTRSYNTEADSSLSRFTADITGAVLLDTDDENGELNTVYSPLSLYMALSVLAECADTETLNELLTFLHADSQKDLRKINNDLFRSMYFDNYNRYNKMANSIWLDNQFNDEFGFNQDTVDRLAQYYYTAVYEKDLQCQDDLDDISEWINYNTSGKLKPQFKPSIDEAVKIINTVTFKESWRDKFRTEEEKEFTLPDGTVKKCMMMTRKNETGIITETEKFIRYTKTFEDGYTMNFVLPAEGSSTDTLLSDSDLLNEMFSSRLKPEVCFVDVSIPSYDVASKFDLKDTIKDLGISRIFDSENADFTPLAEDGDLFVSNITQEAVLTLGKEGCEAAAYTAVSMASNSISVPNYRHVEFNADRPFIYYISDSVNTPLFVGVINDPTEK